MKIPRLFSYIVRVDDGAAPNPFHGMCTLTICKPKIRSVAEIGDWVAGVGGKKAPSGDLRNCLIYAMKVEAVVPMHDYDARAQEEWPHRVPDVNSLDLATRLGDCIYYDFSGSTASQRPGVHGPANNETDLGGKNALISRDFYYFGSRAIPLPKELHDICPVTQGHRSDKNEPYVDAFVSWVRGLGYQQGQLYGWPDSIVKWDEHKACGGCIVRSIDDAGEC